MTYTARLKRRMRKWWSPPRQLWKPEVVIDLLQRSLQRRRLMSRHDPIEKWRRGRYWQRRLNNKWNSREFAAMHGFRIPELYWHGRNPARIPFSELPSHFVIRHAWSSGGRQVYLIADGQDLLRSQSAHDEEIIEALRPGKPVLWPFTVLVEEFLRTTDGECQKPVDYKFHCFNGHVAAIAAQTGRQAGLGPPSVNYYDEHWRALPEPMRSLDLEIRQFEKPASFDEMLECARALSRSYQGYVRIDLYDTDQGCVFGEFASCPAQGKHFSSYADQLLGEFWSRYCDDHI